MKGWIKRNPAAMSFGLGTVALCMGLAVYALDRPPGSVGFLPRDIVSDSGVFGSLAGTLPTFLHVMAFAMITAVFLSRTRRARLAACAVWAAVNFAFEFSQHPAFAETMGFGMYGTFDPFDLLAAWLGATAAFLFTEFFLSDRRAPT